MATKLKGIEDEENMEILRVFIVVVFLLLKIELDNINTLILKMQQHICMAYLTSDKRDFTIYFWIKQTMCC